MRFSVPCGRGLPERANSRVGRFSEDRDDLGRGGDCSWYAGNAREEPSVAQLHLLLLISPFHIPQGFGCCLLFSSSGPSSRLCKHQRRPSLLCLETLLALQLGAWHAPSTVTGDGNPQLCWGLAFHPFPGRVAMLPLLLGASGEGRSLPNPQSNAAWSCCAFCMMPVQHNTLPLVSQDFPPTPKSDESLVEDMGLSCFTIVALFGVLFRSH